MIADYLTSHIKLYFDLFNPFLEIDIVAPIPLHHVRKRARGFNQAELLSRNIAKLLELEHLPRLLKRVKYTQTQTHLNKAERDINVSSAFGLGKNHNISNKNILLVDDVFTTGSTVNNISKLLKENSSGKVFILTIAHA